ncbi:MAG TPA: DNA topoisomerase IV subunit B, partial [Dehalococcoidia bacterium]|nr:DNA topoisomerase IV subunit B [Dehalococcoidia bacterium]
PAEANGDTGTSTTFMFDTDIFEDATFDFNVLAQRFKEMAYLNKGLEIRFKSDYHDTLWPNNEVTYYFDGGIASFVKNLNQAREVVHEEPIYVEKQLDGTIVEAALQYNDSFTEFV